MVRHGNGALIPLALVVSVIGTAIPFPKDPGSGARPVPQARAASPAAAFDKAEKELLDIINRERESRRLPELRMSQSLVRLARAHSEEMARLNVLMHESARGLSLTERLEEAGVAFAANGENVARTNAFDPETVHRSFMASPGHRENILNPAYDEAGIGIVSGKGGTVWVTEDFIKSAGRRSADEVRALILRTIDAGRAAAGLPPLELIEDVSRTALEFARDKAAGRPIPDLPDSFGPAVIRFNMGPDVDAVAASIKGERNADYGRVGIGVWFARTGEYPGGAYYICTILLGGRTRTGTSDLDRVIAIWRAANRVRDKKLLPRLRLDSDLSRTADEVIGLHRQGRTSEISVKYPQAWMVVNMNPKDPSSLPGSVRRVLDNRAWGRIGISTIPVVTEDGVEVMLSVAIVLDRRP
jgi:uncharacterized protein YkwD